MKRFFVVAAVVGLLAGLGAQAWAAYTPCFTPAQYCRWNPSSTDPKGSCWELNKGENDDEDCAVKRSECLQWGYIYTGVPTSGVGAEKKCEGGTWIGEGNNPDFTVVYRKWPTGCEAVLDAAEKANCAAYSSVFSDAGCTVWTGEGKDPSVVEVPLGCCKWDAAIDSCWTIYDGVDADGETGTQKVIDCKGGANSTFWEGACPNTSVGACPSSPPNSVKVFNPKAATPGLKVSYAKNRVTVNWTAPAKVASGTVQLLNAKGVVQSTAFIKGNSNKVTAKLGTVGVPAGMYFVHINAVGQNGQKIVSQSAVSIVK